MSIKIKEAISILVLLGIIAAAQYCAVRGCYGEMGEVEYGETAAR